MKILQPKASAFPVHTWFVGLVLPIISIATIGDLVYLSVWSYRAMWSNNKVLPSNLLAWRIPAVI